ncbi:hypothetical protein EON64_03975 [archaeon]|nr:MAG: hypothetical protein EON64_03975 [archaeon]
MGSFKAYSWLSLLVTCALHVLVYSKYRCHDRCSGHGICNDDNYCWCYDGFSGPDCSDRTCPKGQAWADKPTGIDTAHSLTECSNRGKCNRKAVSCEADLINSGVMYLD